MTERDCDPNAATPIRFDPGAANCVLAPGALEQIAGRLNEARRLVLQRDLELLAQGDPAKVPSDLRPLDAGFIQLPERLLEDFHAKAHESELGRILEAARHLRDQTDRVVVLGIGGSYLGSRALFDAMCDPYHNELSREARTAQADLPVPRIYFEGNNVDNDAADALLHLLRTTCRDPLDPRQRWSIIVISKSGGTLETAAAFRVFSDEARRFYHDQPELLRELIVPVTGPVGTLRDLALKSGFPCIFDIPDRVGGRFSIFTPVGLLPAAVMGIDFVALLEGAAAMTRRFAQQPPEANPVLAYAGLGHLLEVEHGIDIRVLAVWSKALEATGWWYDQLLAESLGKREDRGAMPVTAVHTRDLHSRGQQHQQGKRDKLVTNLIVESPRRAPLTLAPEEHQPDALLAGKTVPQLLDAARKGTCQAYLEDRRPTADLILPALNANTLGQLFQMLMLATVVEGRLAGINPYGQPGVEAYKRHMHTILSN